jgi:hypothetical protein
MRTASPGTRLLTMFIEQRVEPREILALPLKLEDGCSAVTRNISASGMYLEISGLHTLRGLVVFEMHLADARMKFTAEGEVVRIEHRGGNTGLAVKLRTPRLEPLA